MCLADIYSLAVNTDRSIEKVLVDQYDYFSHLAGPIKTLREVYRERKLKANAMDYDDLLVNTLRLFQEHGEVAERYREQFLHVLVDEYQDTNKIQAELIDAIAMLHRNLMVVGDDAQSIYSWRGANYPQHPRFPDALPERAYVQDRSQLSQCAEHPHARQRSDQGATFINLPRCSRRCAEGGVKPWLIPCPDSNQQSLFVAQRILELRDEGVALNDDRGALSGALPRDGTADGTDATEHPVRHHQRLALLRAGACEGCE